MPAGNRTGPAGFGPMTGRAAGFCAGFGVPGYINPVRGRGRGGYGRGGGRGFGGGFGRGWGGPGNMPHYGAYNAPPYPNVPQVTREQEVDMLKRQAEDLGQMLSGINARIEELGKENPAGEK